MSILVVISFIGMEQVKKTALEAVCYGKNIADQTQLPLMAVALTINGGDASELIIMVLKNSFVKNASFNDFNAKTYC